MPLSKVQLMESPGGPGVTGAVKAGTGISITSDGTISVTSTGGVSKLVAGSGITLSPTSGVGDVTISAASVGGVSKLIAGSGVTISPTTGVGDVTISATSGGGGTVTSIATSSPITGGTITGTGTIGLAASGVTAGSYTAANITVDSFGRVTSASNGSAGGVSSFSAGTTGFSPTSASTGAVTLSGILNITNGGTGSATKNFVDLTTAQTIAGLKTFTDPSGIKGKGFNDSAGTTSGWGFVGTRLTAIGQTQATLTGADANNFCNLATALAELKTGGYTTISGTSQVTVQTSGAAVVSVQWTVGSDQRWKTNINPVDTTTVDAYKNAFKNLNFVTYEIDQTVLGTPANGDPSAPVLGLIAQEVEAIEPDFVDTIDMSRVETWDPISESMVVPDHHYPDTKCLKGGLQSVTQLLLQRALQDLDDLRAEFDSYVATHP